MFEINGREIGLAYTVKAHCDFTDWIVKHGQDVSADHALAQKAIIMSQAYCDKNGGKPLTLEELKDQPFYVLKELGEAVDEQELKDSERTVETETPPGKKEKSAAV